MAARARAESARYIPARPPPFLPQSNVRHERGRTSPRTAPPPPRRPPRSGCGGGRRGRAGIGRRGAGAVEARRLGIEAPQVLAGLLQLLLVADRAIAVYQSQQRVGRPLRGGIVRDHVL